MAPQIAEEENKSAPICSHRLASILVSRPLRNEGQGHHGFSCIYNLWTTAVGSRSIHGSQLRNVNQLCLRNSHQDSVLCMSTQDHGQGAIAHW